MEKLHLPLHAITPGDSHLCWLKGPVHGVVGRLRPLTWLGKAPRSAVLGVRDGIKG